MSPTGAARIGRYQVVRQIGAGAMGIVYLAVDSRLGRQVALKVLPRQVASDTVRRRRFLREARAASRINHPNVAQVYEVGEHEGTGFLALEFIDGEDLRSLLRGEPVPVARIVQIATEIADALDAAHQKGIIHRDIKPGNIMLTRRGRVKLLDFGLAKLRRIADEETLDSSTLTAAGLIVGTIEYMSPEQALGRDLDERSDLFSLGSVLYEMSTGVRPFCGSSKAEIVSQIIHIRPQAIAQLNKSIPAELGRIILRCLEKDPGRRYQSAHDLLADLRHLRRRKPAGRAEPLPRPEKRLDGVDRRVRTKIAVAAIMAIAAGVAVWWWFRA